MRSSAKIKWAALFTTTVLLLTGGQAVRSAAAEETGTAPAAPAASVGIVLEDPLVPTPLAPRPVPDRAEIDRLIAQLGSELYADREKAQKELTSIGEAAVPDLKAATGGNDAERALRAKVALVEIARQTRLQRMHARRLSGEIVELTVTSPEVDRTRAFVDLDAGTIVLPPPEVDLHNRDTLWQWAEENGVDAVADTRPDRRGLFGFGLDAGLLNDKDWDHATFRTVEPPVTEMSFHGGFAIDPRSQWLLKFSTMRGYGSVSHTWGFRTREGSWGILEFLEYTEDLDALVKTHPGGTINFRFKLLPDPNVSLATQPAAK